MSSALAAPNVHVVFSAECNHALTWQSVGIFHSHKAVNQPGPITRLLACSDEQLQTYRGMDIGPTFVHHNMRFGHPLIDEVGYPSYNKPASVMFWLDQVDVKEEFIALLDTDMQLREPLDPVALGARRGVVVSAEYAYLVGTKGKFVRRFLEAEEEPLAAQCGGFHIFHRDDLRVIAPLWVEFTKRVRAFAKEDMESCACSHTPQRNGTHSMPVLTMHILTMQGTARSPSSTGTRPRASRRPRSRRGATRRSGRRRCTATPSGRRAPTSPTSCAATRCSTPGTSRARG